MTDPYPPARETSLAERKRQLVRDELAEAALKLLASQGFEDTTIDQMVAAAGVSQRTFFRYFGSKEDVVVYSLADTGAQLCAALTARPADEPPAVALRAAISVFITLCLEHPAKSLRLARVMLATPSLLGRYLERQAEWRRDIAVELGRRLGLDPADDLRPELAAGVALTAFDVALRRWAASDGTEDLDPLTDQTFAIVADTLNAGLR
ncbi:acyl-CoA-like ligand-binding transcription factor [Phytohabitans suffuscus]|uniref:TetR family transcriptional regulator n=1 Tax=Phytohabitans suffuscus TaxID=624315 RepID=A0A6F8YCB2_9ACTN|nr:TetR family transcriptional regulator [Phytohabitans suffuscus]BCB83736.1 TetR family transcriptional regulator [Phytohabitans suffuscus]